MVSFSLSSLSLLKLAIAPFHYKNSCATQNIYFVLVLVLCTSVPLHKVHAEEVRVRSERDRERGHVIWRVSCFVFVSLFFVFLFGIGSYRITVWSGYTRTRAQTISVHVQLK